MHLYISLLLVVFYVNVTVAEVSFSQGQAAYIQNNLEASKKMFEQLLLEKSEESRTLFYLAKIANKQAKFDEAEKLLLNSLALVPEKDEANKANIYYWLGITMEKKAEHHSIFSASKNGHAALKHYLKAIELQPSNSQFRTALINFYLDAPSMAGGSFDDAMLHTRLLTKQDPLAGYKALMDCYKKDGNLQELETVYLNAIKQFPNDPEIYQKMAFHWMSLKHYDRAFDALEKSVSVSVSTAMEKSVQLFSQYQIGMLALKTKDKLDVGIDSLKSFLTHHQTVEDHYLPPTEWARFRMANLFELQGDQKLADAIYEALKENTKDEELLEKIEAKL